MGKLEVEQPANKPLPAWALAIAIVIAGIALGISIAWLIWGQPASPGTPAMPSPSATVAPSVPPASSEEIKAAPSIDGKTPPSPTSSSAHTAPTGTEIGNLAPDFTLKDPAGMDIKLSDSRGKNVFLHFWDAGCPKCMEEMPHIQKVWEAHQKDNDLAILAVNLGGNTESVQSVMKGYGYTFTALLDSNRSANQLYGEPCCPGTFLIDRQGVIKEKKEGAFTDAAHIEAALSNLR